jgi:hypothetical protein
MRTLCATVLITLLCADPLHAEGSLTRAITAEAVRLAAEEVEPSGPHGWRAVRALDPGTPIVLTTTVTTAPRVFVAADDVSVTVLNLNVLPDAARRQLRAATMAIPEAVADTAHGAAKAVNDFVIGPEGVFLRGVKLAERSDVIDRVAAADVVTMTTGLVRRGSASSAAVGAALGGWLSLLLARYGGIETNTGAAVVFGLPIVAGYAAWAGSSREIDAVIYRRSPAP